MTERNEISYANELARKSIHLSSLLIPVVYLNIEHWTGMLILLCMTSVSVGIDFLMHYHRAFRATMLRLVGPLLRQHELRTDRLLLTGASWVLIAATLTMALFPKIIAVTAFTILIISDTAAALVGRQFGNRKFLDKSVIGTGTFIITAWGVVAVYASIFHLPASYIVCGVVAGVIGGVVEAGSIRLKLDDNLSIPFSIALMLWLGGSIAVALGFPAFAGLVP